MRDFKFDASKVDLQNLQPMGYTFFDWWEDFTELAYSKNLEITKDKDYIRDKWYDKEFTIEQGIKRYTR